MSETKFTKNMEVGDTTNGAPICVDGFCNVDGKSFEVCAVWGVDDDSALCDQSKANAHLIASAPEMYDMIERVVYHLESGDGDHFDLNDALIPELKLTLKRARGES